MILPSPPRTGEVPIDNWLWYLWTVLEDKLSESDVATEDTADLTEIGGVIKTNVTDSESVQALIGILNTLKKIEYHLSLGTDTELKDEDV